MARSVKRGALAKDPTFRVATDPAQQAKQRARIEQEIARRGGAAKAPGYAKRLEMLNQASNPQQSTPATGGAEPVPEGPNYESINNQANQGMSQFMQQMQDQGAFNPGSFDAQMQNAQNSVMDSFNRRMDPQFQQQQSSFEQRMAEKGVMPGTEQYNREFQNIQQSQNDQRLNAMNQAYQTGMGAQQQGYNQAANTYQMPANMLGAYAPMYAGQTNFGMQNDQQGWQSGENNMDRQQQEDLQRQQFKYNMKLQAAAPRGGGGGGGGQMSMADRFALMDRELYNNMIMQGAQNMQQAPSGGGMSNGIAQGVGAGVGMAIGGMLR